MKNKIRIYKTVIRRSRNVNQFIYLLKGIAHTKEWGKKLHHITLYIEQNKIKINKQLKK
ncbi:hypothetical protein O3M35_005136 [Rhynocoris fuscipes]|uniref:Uncharacterized protein n=1 Tax=Rhynocoris fuscipes TaxID=488301 RepID=A0AAW1DPP7_9HEMI